MIKSIEFTNYKVLRSAELPLGRFNLLVGPNGSGKSTALEAFHAAGHPHMLNFERIISAEVSQPSEATIEIQISWDEEDYGQVMVVKCEEGRRGDSANYSVEFLESVKVDNYQQVPDVELIRKGLREQLQSARVFSFNPRAIARPTKVLPWIELETDGSNLAGVLDLLQGKEPEKFEALTKELTRWLPEFDRILLDINREGEKFFMLRRRGVGRPIPASDLSHGTLIAVAFLTLAFLPQPPSIIGIEEPETFFHPRLLRDVAENMYRLSYPENYGDTHAPVQVIATTHSPYLLDHYKEHPEEIIIAERDERGGHFSRLSDRVDASIFLEGASLGEVWYSGVLGGVPSRP